MRMKTLRLIKACLVTLFIVVLAGCAVQVPAPEKEVTLATQSIVQAESSGAVEFAPLELQAARDKLNQAKLAMDKKEHVVARRLADEAMVDANLAEAKARSAKSQKVVEELKESIRILQQEMNR
ncbi:DUF4398 domain-containing protein [Pelovirga terrestris]|uniref:DUF4398 domain-containing protein n=1 Tax=Pelovirga terrestris TaxID=2771352 RepID=A0A8J6QX64_9BACT|nr:DUF4398 domain-containing protein [Pelovirga terrestris]MBD1400593.1 DUF4398 domain-containing protein [Pelovirga terrestris]